MTTNDPATQRLFATAFHPIERWTPGAKVIVLALLVGVLVGFSALIHQWLHGLGVTGMDAPIFWGVYITNFVFFIGISHAGTLISAILRVTGADWRGPLTRMAEAITVFALAVGPLQVIFDLGRPDRIPNIFKHPHFTSPLLWDVCCIGTYFLASITYLCLPLIPDLALLRDRYPQRQLYRWLALGWQDTERQRHFLKKAINVMAILVIPIAVSVHTVVSWVFGMTVQPMWHSSIFGPYFVVGAIYSGIATLLIAMALFRRVYRLEEFLQAKHFEYLGHLLITLAALWAYFTFAEYLTTFYGGFPDEMHVFHAKVNGEFGRLFWVMVYSMVTAFLILTLPFIPFRKGPPRSLVGPLVKAALAGVAAVGFMFLGWRHLQSFLPGYVQPGPSLPLHLNLSTLGYHGLTLVCLVGLAWNLRPLLHDRVVLRVVLASILVNIGMWLERFIIVVPSLSHPRLPLGITVYHPTWVEWSLTGASCALFALLFVVFSRFFPMLPVWEMLEEKKAAETPASAEALAARSEAPLPA